MSAYTEQVLIDKLRLLSDSQQSIQSSFTPPSL